MFVPRCYDAACAWPAILFLHGAGERGTDGLLQTEVGLGSAIRRAAERYPAIVVFPQAPPDASWQGLLARVALAALDQTVAELHVDASRTYLTGLSMGGNGAWYLAYNHPDRFAAIAVICGFVTGLHTFPDFVPAGEGPVFRRVAARIRHLPVWMVHGEADPVIPVTESRSMDDALRAAGASVHYVELAGVGHGSWDLAYQSPELAAWLFAQRRR
jgi:predicted peptidase